MIFITASLDRRTFVVLGFGFLGRTTTAVQQVQMQQAACEFVDAHCDASDLQVGWHGWDGENNELWQRSAVDSLPQTPLALVRQSQVHHAASKQTASTQSSTHGVHAAQQVMLAPSCTGLDTLSQFLNIIWGSENVTSVLCRHSISSNGVTLPRYAPRHAP